VSQPAAPFGSSTRDGVRKVYVSEKHSTATFGGAASNGPASYTLKGSVGNQLLSPNRTQASWVFGTGQRFRDPEIDRQAKLPAPDAYTIGSGLGPQCASTKHSAPLPGFGSSTRDHMMKVFMTPEHEKTNSYGKASPGPLTYDPIPGIGRQLESTKRQSPTYGFGTCDRWYTHKLAKRFADTPAPGAYNV